VVVEAAMVMGRDLIEHLVSIVSPRTILASEPKLEKEKWNFSDCRKNNPGRPRIDIVYKK
jgi:hypothetical protein